MMKTALPQLNREPSRRGTVLILSLMVLSSVIIAAVGLSQLIINSLQQTKTLDRATIAYYAAESGVEEAIWLVRRTTDPDAPLPRAIPDPDNQAVSEIDLPNGSFWTRDVSIEEDEIHLAIPEYSFFEMHLFEPSNRLGSLGDWNLEQEEYKPEYLRVEWGDADTLCDPASECPTLVTEWVRWPIANLESDPFNPALPGIQVFTKRYVPSISGPGIMTAIVPPGGTGFSQYLDLNNYAYRVRLRAENGTLRNVVVKAFNRFNQQAKLPGRVVVDGYGQYGDIVQRVTVRIPRRSPLSSLFDFAIFSECSLVKGYPISCP